MKSLIFAGLLFSFMCPAAPVPLTGSGTFSCDILDQVYSFSAHGTDGTNTVDVSVQGNLPQPPASSCIGQTLSGSTMSSSAIGFASINSTSSPFFSFSLGSASGPGTLTLLNNSFSPIASISIEALISNVNYTMFHQNPRDISGTFQITSAPEPSTWAMFGAGVSLLFLGSRRRVTKGTAA